MAVSPFIVAFDPFNEWFNSSSPFRNFLMVLLFAVICGIAAGLRALYFSWRVGDRWAKATSEDYRFWFGVLFLAPIFFGLAFVTGTRFSLFDASRTVVTLYISTVFILFFLTAFLWAKHVPPRISLILALVTWAIIIGVVLHQNRFFPFNF